MREERKKERERKEERERGMKIIMIFKWIEKTIEMRRIKF